MVLLREEVAAVSAVSAVAVVAAGREGPAVMGAFAAEEASDGEGRAQEGRSQGACQGVEPCQGVGPYQGAGPWDASAWERDLLDEACLGEASFQKEASYLWREGGRSS